MAVIILVDCRDGALSMPYLYLEFVGTIDKLKTVEVLEAFPQPIFLESIF